MGKRVRLPMAPNWVLNPLRKGLPEEHESRKIA
jgi:hypothetical protein